MLPAKRTLLRIWKTAQAVAANAIFGFPGGKLRVVGVTGTDGKTTTAHLIITALESAGYTVGAVSTIQYQVGTRVWANTSKLTTPGPWALARLLAHMVRSGCHYVVLECSSHRLDQGGLWGIPVDVAVITNVTREHLDYHRDLGDYAWAKRRLFRALRHPAKILPHRRNVDRGGRIPTVAVANLDDERCAAMLDEPAEKKYGFTLGHGPEARGRSDVTVVTARPVDEQSLRPVAQGLRPSLSVVRAGDYEALLHLKLPGTFNLQNALAAIAVGTSQGIELARITRELSKVERVSGRMDAVEKGQPFTVIIDYAVTPAAFEALYEEVRRLSTSYKLHATSSPKIIHVFGAAGERDRGKRPLLGEIAGRNADLVILTDEDPFGENPDQILGDIEKGLRQAAGRNYVRIRDRRLAIREALSRAQLGDIVLVTGKGAEETMAVGSRRIPWNDRRVIEEELVRLALSQAS